MTEQATTTKALAKPPKLANIDMHLERMTVEVATKLCKDRPEVAGVLIHALVARNTAELPNTAFVRRADGQIIKKQTVNVKLLEREGHLVPIRRNTGDKDEQGNSIFQTMYEPSIAGLRKMNEIPAIQIIKPEHVTVDGQKRMNPYIQINEKSRTPEVVYTRCVAVGYSSTGTLVASDVMIRLDANIYFLEALQAKMRQVEAKAEAARKGMESARRPFIPAEGTESPSKKAPKPKAPVVLPPAPSMGFYGTDDEKPVDAAGLALPGRWKFLPITGIGGMGLWVNMGHPDFGEVIREHTLRLKFIERLAQSFAERNALKAHPAIPKSLQSTVAGQATVRMTGWITDFRREEIDQLRQLVETDTLHEFRDSQGSNISVERHEGEVGAEDIASVESDVEDGRTHERSEGASVDDGAESDENLEAAAANVQIDDVRAQASVMFQSLSQLKGPSGAKRALRSSGAETIEDADLEQLLAFLTEGKKIIDGSPGD